nr:TonB-dependent receptor [uncultured Carboxylicivirga sp.]
MRQLLIYLSLVLFISTGSVWAQTTTLTGTITDKSNGEPMIGVTILVKGTTVGTVTNIDGAYNLQVPTDAQVLVYSFIGYETQEIAYIGQKELNIQMQDDSEKLGEVVVNGGYVKQKKGAYTGAVEVVEAEKLEQVPVVSFDQALQGQAAGVVATSSSGAPGASATIRVRGTSSVNAGNDPLYIMDGIQITAGQFSSINTNDIKTLTILKDATATSLYGSRASNGVILIETKRGAGDGKTTIQYRGQFGLSQVVRDNFEMMNTAEKIQYEEEIGIKSYTPEEKLQLLKYDTNWFNEALHNAMSESHELSVSGGNETTRFYLSGGYMFQDGIMPRSDFERMTLRLNLDNKISDKSNFGLNLMLGQEMKNNTNTISNSLLNPIFASRMLNPYLYNKNEDGSYNSNGFPYAVNPFEELDLNENDEQTLKIVGGGFFDVELINNLVYRFNVGIDYYYRTGRGYINPLAYGGQGIKGSTTEAFVRNYRLTPTNTLTYKLNLKESHNFTFLLGQEAVMNQSKSFSVSAKNLPANGLKQVSLGTQIASWGGGMSDYTMASFFGNVNYNYKYKYLADFSLRRDGSSRFGVDNRWGTFWSAGLGWNIQEEELIKGIHWIDQLKLRASIGETGNNNIGNYQHLDLFNFGSYQNQQAIYFGQYGNPDLTWERKIKTNVALDLAIFKRYRTKIELYQEDTKDMLFFLPYSWSSGLGGRMENIGEMTNKGIEVEFDLDLIQTKDFNLNVNTNFAYNRNEVTKLYGGLKELDQVSTLMQVGQPLGTFYLTRWAGVDAATGKGLWYKKDDSVTDFYSDSDRVLQEGKSFIAPWNGGMRTTATYKNLSCSVFFTWMANKYLVNNTRYFTESQGMFTSYNQSKEMLDYWKKPGDKAKHPSPEYQDNQFDTRLLENASFLRLKNINLSYNVNLNKLTRSKVFSAAKIYVQGQNLLTFTGYTGIDPEFHGANELNMYPNVKTYTVGIDLSF